MFCQKCGKEIDNEAVVCIHCGCATENQSVKKVKTGENVKSFVYNENFFKLLKALICACVGLYAFLKLFFLTRMDSAYRTIEAGWWLSLWFLISIVGVIGVIEFVIKSKNQNRR